MKPYYEQDGKKLVEAEREAIRSEVRAQAAIAGPGTPSREILDRLDKYIRARGEERAMSVEGRDIPGDRLELARDIIAELLTPQYRDDLIVKQRAKAFIADSSGKKT